jgi:hypothetical protein
LAKQNFIGGFSSCMYRNEAIAKLDLGIWKLKVREWPFNIVIAEQGAIGYVPEILSVYRAHPNGIWSLQPRREHCRQLREIIDPYNEFLNFKYDAEFQALKSSLDPPPKDSVPEIEPTEGGSLPRYLLLRRMLRPFVPPILITVARRVLHRTRPQANT